MLMKHPEERGKRRLDGEGEGGRGDERKEKEKGDEIQEEIITRLVEQKGVFQGGYIQGA